VPSDELGVRVAPGETVTLIRAGEILRELLEDAMYASAASSVCMIESVHSSSRPGVAKIPRFRLYSQASLRDLDVLPSS
jgi:hypothetical protein